MTSLFHTARQFLGLLTHIAFMSKADLKRKISALPLDRASAAELIAAHVQYGFDKASTIFRIVEDAHGSPSLTDADRSWIEKEIRKRLKDKRRSEDTWPEETDWDRLNSAFKALRRKGIVALHNAGVTQSDGLTAVSEAILTHGPDKPLQGYCFYHQQDIHDVLTSKQLLLSYGAIGDTTDSTGKIATIIVEALQKAGLKAEWSGDSSQKIEMHDFLWQKRSPRSTKSKNPKTL